MGEWIGPMVTWPRVVIIISLLGMYFINWRRHRIGFLFFSVGAFGWMLYDIHGGSYERALIMAGNVITPLIGWWRWGRLK
jgi:hypothetical protein